MPAQTVIKVRRDEAANWASADPTLAAGEHGYETDTGLFKIGDGTTAWVTLPYATDWANVTEKPTLGTSASKDVAATGDASSTQVVLGDDSRLTNSRTPTAHAASHESGGTDEIEIAPAQITASSTSGQVLSSNGTTTVWSTPAGGLPTQTGNAGELLVTDGTNASWSNTVTANVSNQPALIVTGQSGQTDNVLEVFRGATRVAAIGAGGQIYANGATNSQQVIVKANSSQSVNIQEWQNSGGTALASIGSTGRLTAPGVNVNSTQTNVIPLEVKGAVSQNTYLQVWRTSDNTIVSAIDIDGAVTQPATNAVTARASGYVGMPQVSTSSAIIATATWRNYAGKHIYTTTTGLTHILPANSSQALEIGTTIVFINPASVTTTIQVTSDTLILAGTGTKASVTLAPYGMATLVKVTATEWIISGNGLT